MHCMCRNICDHRQGQLRHCISFRNMVIQLKQRVFEKEFLHGRVCPTYMKAGTPLAPKPSGHRGADFSDWLLTLHEDASKYHHERRDSNQYVCEDIILMKDDKLLCCLEDHRCGKECASSKKLCPECELPVCRSCSQQMAKKAAGRFRKVSQTTTGMGTPRTSLPTWTRDGLNVRVRHCRGRH